MMNQRESEQRQQLRDRINSINEEFNQTMRIELFNSCTEKCFGRYVVAYIYLYEGEEKPRDFGTLEEAYIWLNTFRLGMVFVKYNSNEVL